MQMQIVQAPRASAILYSVLINLRNKDPWLLPANICPIVPITFFKARIPFQLVDISAKTLHMDWDQAEALIKDRKFGGLLYAHTYGELSTPNELFESIKKTSPELIVIDDRCLCIPDLEPDPDNRADIQLYSTGYAKVVDLGFGGYAFIRNDLNYEPAHLAFHARPHEELEKAYKQAVSQRRKFVYRDSDWLDTDGAVPAWSTYCQQIQENRTASLEQRASLNQIYTNRLPREIQLPARFQTWRFNIGVKNKQEILKKIFSSGLFASSHYASLAGIMDEGHAPQAEGLANCVINLFNDHHFTPDQAQQTCKLILESLS
jgi:hypothetical protein